MLFAVIFKLLSSRSSVAVSMLILNFFAAAAVLVYFANLVDAVCDYVFDLLAPEAADNCFCYAVMLSFQCVVVFAFVVDVCDVCSECVLKYSVMLASVFVFVVVAFVVAVCAACELICFVFATLMRLINCWISAFGINSRRNRYYALVVAKKAGKLYNLPGSAGPAGFTGFTARCCCCCAVA